MLLIVGQAHGWVQHEGKDAHIPFPLLYDDKLGQPNSTHLTMIINITAIILLL